MATSEIEKLERRYAENPHGLTFAPLAEVHRKNGDVARALELLTAGLELHPNYIPASIVLGRCHQDLADHASAEAAFAHVLRLDDENVIALKSLADISERQERYGEAEAWLRRLVAVDRSNDEAHEQLRRVEAAKQGRAARPTEKPVTPKIEAPAEPEPQPEAVAPAPALEMIDLSPQPSAAQETTPAAEPREAENVVADSPQSAEATPLPYIAGLEPTSEPQAPAGAIANATSTRPSDRGPGAPPPLENDMMGQDEPVRPLPGLISAEFQPPLEATGGLGVETSEEVFLEASGNSEFRVPDASDDLKSLAARLSASQPPLPVPPQAVPTPVGPAPKTRAEPEFVVTETMADVLLQQGHAAEALRVYQELARQNGADARLESRILDLQATLAQPPAKRPSYLAHDTQGQSVGAFFRGLLVARPPLGPSSPAAEGRTPDGSADGEEKLPAPPAVSTGEQSADAPVSFDDFFGSKGDGSTSLRQGKADPGRDDLDQFQSWLQNLKR